MTKVVLVSVVRCSLTSFIVGSHNTNSRDESDAKQYLLFGISTQNHNHPKKLLHEAQNSEVSEIFRGCDLGKIV